MDLNLLKVLDGLLQTGSLTQTADKVGLTQPAVSAALGRLRVSLKDPLLVRHGRGMVATDYADTLREPLRRILDDLDSLLSGPESFDPASAEGRYRLSGSDFFAEMLMPDLAERVSRLAPAITVQLVDLVPDSYIDTLDRYKVDLALIPKMDFPNWVDHQVLFNSAFVVIARKGHPRLKRVQPGATIPVDLFCDIGHVLFSPEGKLRAMGDDALAAIGRQRKVALTMPVFSGVYNAVARSDLIALLPAQLANRMAPRIGLDLYQPPMPLGAATICMVWHKRFTNAPAHSWLRDQIAVVTQSFDEQRTLET